MAVRKSGKVAVLVVPWLLLSACTLEPRYARPEPAVADSYPRGVAYGTDTGAAQTAANDLGWRDFFGDERLQQMVEIALRNNRDLRVAVLNVQELRAQLRIQTAPLMPDVSLFADRSRSRTPAELSKTGVVEETESYTVGASLGWEIDLFGKLRSLRAAALQQYLASAQGRKAAQMLLVSQVANQYLTVLACDELLEETERTAAAARASFDIVKLQFEVGAGSELDLRQAETVVEQATANHAAQLRARAQAGNGLVLLLGQSLPTDLQSGRRLAEQGILEDLPAGLPSDLLTRRPDVQQSEALLRSANADIGAARAAFFPSIDLTGSAGSASTRLRGLFEAGSQAWTFAPTLTLPLFAGGANLGNLEASHVRREIAVAQYQKTIQAAFQEVADGLAARGTFNQQIASQVRFTAAQQRRLELAQLLYLNGETNYLDVLTAQTALYEARLALVGARLQRLQNLVDLYRALGGGWLEHSGDQPRPADAR